MTRPAADRDSAPWWAALTEHRLLLQRCSACATYRFVPRAMCNSCGSFDWTWTDACGKGIIASWTVSHRTFQPNRPAPYTVVVVRLAEADNLLLPGGWSGASDGSDLIIGTPVVARYVDTEVEDGAPATLLHWAPVNGVPN